MALRDDEVEPRVLESSEPALVVWSSLWPGRQEDVVRLEIAHDDASGSRLTFTHLTPDDLPDEGTTRHLRHRLDHLFWADLRESYDH